MVILSLSLLTENFPLITPGTPTWHLPVKRGAPRQGPGGVGHAEHPVASTKPARAGCLSILRAGRPSWCARYRRHGFADHVKWAQHADHVAIVSRPHDWKQFHPFPHMDHHCLDQEVVFGHKGWIVPHEILDRCLGWRQRAPSTIQHRQPTVAQ